MSHGEGSQGTGLGDIFNILSQAPSERLLSLTLQLNDSPEDVIIVALCLIILKREVHALDKLRTLEENPLADHLAEKLHPSRLEDFSLHCGQFQASTRESLSALARIFQILSQQRLCDQTLRDLAYKRALSSNGLDTRPSDDLDHHEFREEAKLVCGPKVLEWTVSANNPKPELMHDFKTCLNVSDTTPKISKDSSASINCAPSPLQESPSEPSYPSTLEISSPSTVSFKGDKVSQENLAVKPATPIACESETKMAPGQPLLSLLQPTGSSLSGPERSPPTLPVGPLECNFVLKESPDAPSMRSHTNPPSSTNICRSRCPVQEKMHNRKASDEEEEEEEEEETFYAFVIFHAPEDEDIAVCIKTKIEEVISSKGATFSEEFAIAGKHPLRCVEDAINNSAFTFLLLTCNFKSNMLEMKTNIALMNAINNIHKYNTVIPLLPQENRMPKHRIPMVLNGLVPLDETKNFEKKLQKSLSRAKIQTQKRVWKKEQALRMKERLSQLKLEEEKQRLLNEKLCMGMSLQQEQSDEDSRTWQQKQPNIHIENAKYVMIGNDSKMVVDLGGSADKKESVHIDQDE